MSKVTKFFVGNLPWTVSSRELRKYFQSFGHVASADVLFDHSTGISKGYGFVQFSTEGGHQNVLNSPKHELDGQTVIIKAAESQRSEPQFIVIVYFKKNCVMDLGSKHLSVLFEKAVAFVSGSSLSDVDLQLKLYGLYKQAVEGECNRPKPSVFDLKNRKKWFAWSELGSMAKEEAMAAYVDTVKIINPTFEEEKTGWVTVSTFANDEQPLTENEKTISDWVKEGDLEKIKKFSDNINVNDAMGMAPVHWASDRGDLKVLKFLIENLSADINLQDVTGQTALHYAVSCGHEDVCEYLIRKGASTDIQDEDGFTAFEICSEERLKSILSKN